MERFCILSGAMSMLSSLCAPSSPFPRPATDRFPLFPPVRSTLKALNKSLQSELQALQNGHRQLNDAYERLSAEYKALVDAQEHFASEFQK